MFRWTMCSSSGESTISIHLAYVIYDRLVTYSFGVSSIPAYQTVTYIVWHMPDVVLVQLILLMMSTWLLETCRISKRTYTENNCASNWLVIRTITAYWHNLINIFHISSVNVGLLTKKAHTLYHDGTAPASHYNTTQNTPPVLSSSLLIRQVLYQNNISALISHFTQIVTWDNN